MATKKNGRPSAYDPAFCDQVEADMKEGWSLRAFAGKIGTGRQTLIDWARAHPEFAAAIERGKCARLRWWEGKARAIASGASGNGNLVMFGLRNMGGEDWAAPRMEIAHSGPQGEALAPLTVNTFVLPAGHMIGADGVARPLTGELLEIAHEMASEGLIDAREYNLPPLPAKP